MGFENPCQQNGKQDLDHVEHDKRHDARHQRGADAHGCVGVSFHEDEPSGSERIAHEKSDEHTEDPCEQFIFEKRRNAPIHKRGKEKSDDVTAGYAAENADPTAEAREHGRADHAEQEITGDGDRSFFAAEQPEREKNAENLQRKRDRRRNGYPSGNANKRGKQRDENE